MAKVFVISLLCFSSVRNTNLLTPIVTQDRTNKKSRVCNEVSISEDYQAVSKDSHQQVDIDGAY
jgi:hypothetical protein